MCKIYIFDECLLNIMAENKIDIESLAKESSFQNSFNQFYNALCFFADKMLRDRAAAEDTVENVFIKLWEKKPDFNDYKNIKAVLYISVRNACFNLIKKRRSNRFEQDELSYLLNQESQDFILSEITRAEVLREIYEEMQKLPPECRKVMQFYFVEGLDAKDIASRLGVAVSTVRNQKAYGTKILKAKFGRNFFLLLSYSVPLVMLQN
jgi:RNA polymerase sigma-70 factor (family 1)